MNSFSKCVVCTDPETSVNRIFCCEQCEIRVHMLCYGIVMPEDEILDLWWCAPCASNCFEPVCKLCLQKGGALKKTSCGNYVHVICALFTEGVEFQDKMRMEPVNISRIPKKNQNKTCMFCCKNSGICCGCSNPNCQKWIHVTCAQNADCLIEANQKNNKIAFLAYCGEHKPSKSSRRISSIFVREKLVERSPEGQQRQLEPSAITVADDDSETLLSAEFSDIEQSQNDTDNPSDILNDIMDDDKNTTNHYSVYDANDDQPKPTSPKQIVRDENSFWWDSRDLRKQSTERHELEAQLHSKDNKIMKLKAKKKELKSKVDGLLNMNSNLQLQIQQLNSQLQQQLLISKSYKDDGPTKTKPKQDVIKVLKKRIECQLSEDGSDWIYSNGVKVSVKLARQLETISGGANSDRTYINTHFFMVFPEKYIRKQVKRGLSWEDILSKFRSSNRYETMKDLYEYRVLRNGEGDVNARLRLFKFTFRTKLYNWWIKNGPKFTANNST